MYTLHYGNIKYAAFVFVEAQFISKKMWVIRAIKYKKSFFEQLDYTV